MVISPYSLIDNVDALYGFPVTGASPIDEKKLTPDAISIDIPDDKKTLKKLDKLEKKIAAIESTIEDNTLLKLGSLRIAKYWGVDEDEDEDEGDGKSRVLGAHQHAVFACSLITIAVLSGYLGNKSGQSVFASSIAGPSMEIVKKYFPYTKDNAPLRYTMVALSALALAGSIALPYLPTEHKGQLVYRVATAIPWAYPAFGILKSTFSNSNIAEFFSSKNFSNYPLSLTQTKILSAITQITLIVGLQMGLIKANINDPSLAAASGIFYKTNARALTNIAGEETAKIEQRTVRMLIGGVSALAVVGATATGYAGNSLHWFNSYEGLLIGYLLISITDVFVRTIKQSIRIKVDEVKVDTIREKMDKVSNQEEPTWSQRAYEATKKIGYGLLNCVVPVTSAFVLGAMNPDPNNTTNAGLLASLTQDATALCKLPTKLLPTQAVLAVSGLAIGLGVAGFTVNEMSNLNLTAPLDNVTQGMPSFEWPCYSATIALACIAASFAGYHAKKLIHPPKVKEVDADVDEKIALKQAKKEAKEQKKNKKIAEKPLETTSLLNNPSG